MILSYRRTLMITMIDQNKFTQLSALSKIDFTPEEESRFTTDLNAIIAWIDGVKSFPGVYDDTLEEAVAFADLREDLQIRTATPEQLLSNTKSENDCYVIPKVVDGN
jgi:aspartyl/glutamyl-tRNA(Asn/Gln) amidotransferase C subunit